MLDKAFETLATYDWGDDPGAVHPIDKAVVATQHDAKGRRDLEKRLLAVLAKGATRDGKDFVCRKLKVVGTKRSVPPLAALLSDANDAHMARYALESMPHRAAGKALLNALPKLSGELKIGVIGSLGVRQEDSSVPALAALLGDEDARIAQSAAHALAAIRTAAAADVLTQAKPNPAAAAAATDASLACAESLLAAGDRAAALEIYQRLAKGEPARHVKLAATRGMLACAGK
ncbi:HEAT repeat domain-containing protein [Pirellulales bacterium]|nr:HEAT repeat domain-containing protein [Pirellulales bacterium]